MDNELLKSIAASTSYYEFENDDSVSIMIDWLESVINLYLELCSWNKDAIDRAVRAINADKKHRYEYFYYDAAETFLEKYGD